MPRPRPAGYSGDRSGGWARDPAALTGMGACILSAANAVTVTGVKAMSTANSLTSEVGLHPGFPHLTLRLVSTLETGI